MKVKSSKSEKVDMSRSHSPVKIHNENNNNIHITIPQPKRQKSNSKPKPVLSSDEINDLLENLENDGVNKPSNVSYGSGGSITLPAYRAYNPLYRDAHDFEGMVREPQIARPAGARFLGEAPRHDEFVGEHTQHQNEPLYAEAEPAEYENETIYPQRLSTSEFDFFKGQSPSKSFYSPRDLSQYVGRSRSPHRERSPSPSPFALKNPDDIEVRRRGRPLGAKDKQPRQRRTAAASLEDQSSQTTPSFESQPYSSGAAFANPETEDEIPSIKSPVPQSPSGSGLALVRARKEEEGIKAKSSISQTAPPQRKIVIEDDEGNETDVYGNILKPAAVKAAEAKEKVGKVGGGKVGGGGSKPEAKQVGSKIGGLRGQFGFR